jgi:insertion element IS1 protein InsB
MSAPALNCPRCQSTSCVKNGRIHNGGQNFKCKACGRQFVLNPTKKVIGQDTTEWIDKLLLEKIPLAGIARVTGVSEGWLQTYVNTKYDATPRQVDVWPKKGVLDYERACDQMWSFVSNKGNKQSIWLALEMKTGEIVGVFVGDRSRLGSRRIMAVTARSISAMRGLLYRLLGCV